MNRKFIRTSTHKDDRHRDPRVKATLRKVRDADDAEDVDLDGNLEGMTQNRWSWDKRRTSASNAAKRWVRTQAKRGLTWNEIRPLLIEKLGDAEEADYLVEHAKEIDGKLYIVSAYFGPIELDEYYSRDCVVVLPNGKLHHHIRAKATRCRPQKKFFHFEKEEIWFKLENGSIFHAPFEKLRKPIPADTPTVRPRTRVITWGCADPKKFPGFIKLGYNRATPRQFHEMELDMTHARQSATKHAPPEMDELSAIENHYED